MWDGEVWIAVPNRTRTLMVDTPCTLTREQYRRIHDR